MSELRWHGDKALAKARKAVKQGLEAAGVVVETEAMRLIVQQNIIDTGNLLNSISHEVDGETARVGTAVEYAVYQEYGTRFMAARPWLRPAVDEHHAEIRKAFADALRGAFS